MKLKFIIILVAIFLFGGVAALASETDWSGLNPNLGSGTFVNGVLVVKPTASKAADTYNSSQSVTLTSTGSNTIRYTTNGSDPACPSTGTLYAGTLTVNSSMTLKAIACYKSDNSVASAVSSYAYVFACAISSVANGTVTTYSSCTITCNSGYTKSGNTCVASSSSSSGGGGGVVTSSITTVGSDTLTVPMSINNTQTGNLTQPLSNGSKVELVVPVGAVAAQTTFSATTGSLTSIMTPVNTTGALMVGNQVFNITAISNNTAVRNFSGNLSITLTVPDLPDNTANLGVYHFNDTTGEWNLVPGAVFDPVNNKVTFQVNHLTKFSVFNILGLPSIIKTASASTVVTPPVVQPSPTPIDNSDQIKNIVAEAATIAGRSVQDVLTAVGAMRDIKAENAAATKYTAQLVSGLKNINAEIKDALTHFINYGTPTTLKLGAGERAGVIGSYKSAFGKVPSTEDEWSDAIKIGNGRWPSVLNASAEAKAALEFKKVYKRAPNMSNANDNAAVTIIAYGLRPTARNTNSEKAAIKSFRYIYGHDPINALAWDIVRAIAYSGAKR